MPHKETLKTILARTKPIWDHPEMRPAVRTNFHRALKCRTGELGAEVYASDTEYKVVPHTCKSRACSSCGHRATTLWQTNILASLPDVPATGIVLTMPQVLWPLFCENRDLLSDLARLGASVVEDWMMKAYAVTPMIMVICHTFGRHLNFNCHLHMLASTGGLSESNGSGEQTSFLTTTRSDGDGNTMFSPI